MSQIPETPDRQFCDVLQLRRVGGYSALLSQNDAIDQHWQTAPGSFAVRPGAIVARDQYQ
ncbi:hypothetical protein ACFCWD_38750 [Streptomyces sp. NPDC056374]|uniref:hypothetical protein n=1 Tax=unclassified Streptomyces TaxID=2593676 RepID=UPI0035E34320